MRSEGHSSSREPHWQDRERELADFVALLAGGCDDDEVISARHRSLVRAYGTAYKATKAAGNFLIALRDGNAEDRALFARFLEGTKPRVERSLIRLCSRALRYPAG